MKKNKSIIFVCHGNICRSPMAEFVMLHYLKEAGVNDVVVTSAATSTEAVGFDMHRGSKAQLDAARIPYSPRKARQITVADAAEADLMICMDMANVHNLRRMIPETLHSRICRMLDFTSTSRDVADPWYTHDYSATFADITAGCKGLLEKIVNGWTV